MNDTEYKLLCEVLAQRVAGVDLIVSLPEADLRGADLWRADLVGADLRGAKLDHAGLVGAKLSGAFLEGASLAGAKLNGADLYGAALANADLSGAHVVGVSFAGADLRGACLKDLHGEPSSFAGARIDALAVQRSEMSDQDVIQLWRAGADLESIDAFTEAVRRAAQNGDGATLDDEDLGPPNRQIAVFEFEQRRTRVPPAYVSTPPSSIGAAALARLSMAPPLLTGPVSRRPSAFEPEPPSFLLAHPVPDIVVRTSKVPSLVPGREILGVRLERRIGTGNAASVWEAVDSDAQKVALKVFDPERRSALIGLARSVRTMNQLMLRGGDALPPSIQRLRCVSVNALAFTTDRAIGSLVDIGALNWSTPKHVGLFRQIAEAIAWAHDAGVVHRCLKPSNVLIDGDFCPVISDFDVVDLPMIAAQRPDDFGGYRPYAAPEEVVDFGMRSPTADIFGLGRLLYFLLLGKDPDEPAAETPKLTALLGSHPAGLVRIIRKCTMLDPAARYQWVSELLADLSNYERYDEVGVAGGERNYLCHRISTVVAHPRAAAPAPLAQRARKEAVAQRRPGRWWQKRSVQIRIAAAAGAVAMLSLGVIFFAVPNYTTLRAFVDLAIVSAGLSIFALWRPKKATLRGRFAFGMGTAIAVSAVDPAGLMVLHAQVSIRSGNPNERAQAFRVLASTGRFDFRGLDLSSLDLSSTDLTLADLRDSNLTRTTLRGSQLREAKLARADLTDAVIEDVDLSLSDAPGAKGWSTTACSVGTRMPQGWTCSSGKTREKTALSDTQQAAPNGGE